MSYGHPSTPSWATSTILHRHDLPPTVKAKALDAVLRNAESLTRLVNDLLDMSRMVTGKLRLSLSTVSVSKSLTTRLRRSRPALAAKKIALRLDLPADLELIGDADRLRQVVWNLLLNATKFTPVGGSIAVRASTDGQKCVHRGGRHGRGYRGGTSRSGISAILARRSRAGRNGIRWLGLGLALARHLVELHGGTSKSPAKASVRARPSWSGSPSSASRWMPSTARNTRVCQGDETAARLGVPRG